MKLNLKENKQQLEKIALLVIGGVIVFIVLVTLVFGPNIRNIKRLSAKIREQRGKVVTAEKEIAGLVNLKSNLEKLEENIKQYQLDMPLGTPDWLLEKLNSLAGEIGIDFDKIEPKGNIDQQGSYALQGLYIELKTDYHRLGVFLNKLENSSPFLRLLDLSITANKEDINKHVVKLTVGAYVKTQINAD